ncbi:CRAL-TRIO domain-containing protein [Naematelia encephala]|uniref:CRAL-TRIO domain-containing protein n=1 Tax=Naematelia encephala TaxID=71784 RepID=A0A1Y2BIH8_9TREE|nr:CRAL-TRIO domain-containing protein [Naematelia encephala]
MSSILSFGQKSASSSSTSVNKKNYPPTSEVITTPPPEAVPKKKWNYDQAQLKMIEQLREYTKTLLIPESDPYHPWEKRFLADPGCHPRYCRAAKWKFEDAKKRIKETLEWRREFKPELIQPGDVGIEAETGKIILTGFDADARPILYMRPGRENTETSPRQIRHLIYNLERAIDFMPPGQEQVAIIIDYKSATSQSNPSISTGRKVLNILQNHYVERLGRGLVINMPWWINAFFSGISPFLDPITRDKIRFNPKLVELVPESQLDAEFGGQYNFQYDFKVYWKTVTEFCHIAEDGSRVDNEGKKWYPPLGNGIKAASEGLVPKQGAISTGQVAKANGDSSSAGEGGRTEEVAAAGTGASVAATYAAEQKHIEAEGKAAEPSPQDSTADEVADGVGAMDIAAAPTKPGAPTGDVVFDHPPSKSEQKEARASMEARGTL